MKYKRRSGLKLFVVAALLPVMTSGAIGQLEGSQQSVAVRASMSASDQATAKHIEQMVRDFLAEVPKGDRKVFENFFADDVIYTRSAGVTVDKAEVLNNIDVRAANQPQAKFEADSFTVHPYGDTAVVNFRLVMHNIVNGQPETVYFRNTGTFLKRNSKWQVVAWQSTKVPLATETKP
ncbi:MAG TPA: nuclear transport factor 2 family protein [Terriglobales bacterium]